MRAEGEIGFPPGEIGARFNMIRDVRAGGFYYVRMQARRGTESETGSFPFKLLMPSACSSFADAFQVLWVPRSQIVCEEPAVMIAEGGIVRALE